jgi:hypothetical protein
VSAFVTAGAGFLLAVLWFDLMFDAQVVGHRSGELPEGVLASIAAYYRRVTTEASPMDRLIALGMLATLAAIVAEIVRREPREWVAWVSLALAVAPITLATVRVFPNAVRLASRTDSPQRQSELAREIFRLHVICFASIAALLALQLSFA